MADEKVKLGVLWKQVSREGNKPYLSGRADQQSLEAAMALLRRGGRFLILSNKKRPEKRDPDCVLFVVPEKNAPGGADAAGALRGKGGSAGPFD